MVQLGLSTNVGWDGSGTFLPSSDPPQVLRTMNTDWIRGSEKPEGGDHIIGSGISVIKSQQQQSCIMTYEGRGFQKEDEVPFSGSLELIPVRNSISARLFEASERIKFCGFEADSSLEIPE